MFHRFTGRARHVLTRAQDEARALDHAHIGTEHLLLGLLADDSGTTAHVLAAEGIDRSAVRARVTTLIERGAGAPATAAIPFSARAKEALEWAVREAREMSHDHIGTEHLLLGLAREGGGVAARVLNDLGVSLHRLRDQIAQTLTAGLGDTAVSTVTARPGGEASHSDTGPLEQFARNLTDAARAGALDPVIGREREVEHVMQVLGRRAKNNPVLVGEAGVGKTAVVEGLAAAIAADAVPETLAGKPVYAVDLGAMVAGTSHRGDFEERLNNLVTEATAAGAILFIDELHTLMGAGKSDGAIDAANLLKPALARGELRTIGATTHTEYRKHVAADAALERRFQPVTVEAPSVEATTAILAGLRTRYEDHHGVAYTDDALAAAATLAGRYLPGRQLPDAAIDLIDEAAARLRVAALTASSEDTGALAPTVDADAIAEVLATWTGVPVAKLTASEGAKLLGLEADLHQHVVGQEEAVTAVAKAIRRTRSGLSDPARPDGSFIFLGPSGVGKTELAKSLAALLFGSADALIHLDMSEYMEAHTTTRLIGSPPGYVGYEEGGQLTEAVRRKPYSVVLFDEVEKAHPDVFNTLLAVLEDGRLTDAQGTTVDFTNTIVIMTSNLGTAELGRTGLGFGGATDACDTHTRMVGQADAALRAHFRPEFLNRVDEIVVFHQLSHAHVCDIVALMIDDVRQRLAARDLALEITPAAAAHLADVGYDAELGARPLRRAIQRLVEDPLSEALLAGEFRDGSLVTVDAADGQVTLHAVHASPTAAEPAPARAEMVG